MGRVTLGVTMQKKC